MPAFLLSVDGCKLHLCSNESIVEEVKADLQSRGPGKDTHVMQLGHNEMTWDPGGMIIGKQEQFRFELGDVVFRVDSQHFSQFVNLIERTDYQPRGNKTKYIELHGHYHCLCITPEEYDMLLKEMKDPEMAVKAEQVYLERERRLNALAKQGIIARVVEKREDGFVVMDPNKLSEDTGPQKLN